MFAIANGMLVGQYSIDIKVMTVPRPFVPFDLNLENLRTCEMIKIFWDNYTHDTLVF